MTKVVWKIWSRDVCFCLDFWTFQVSFKVSFKRLQFLWSLKRSRFVPTASGWYSFTMSDSQLENNSLESIFFFFGTSWPFLQVLTHVLVAESFLPLLRFHSAVLPGLRLSTRLSGYPAILLRRPRSFSSLWNYSNVSFFDRQTVCLTFKNLRNLSTPQLRGLTMTLMGSVVETLVRIFYFESRFIFTKESYGSGNRFWDGTFTFHYFPPTINLRSRTIIWNNMKNTIRLPKTSRYTDPCLLLIVWSGFENH